MATHFNKTSVLHIEELSSNEMVNKFIETANKVGDKVHARVPCDIGRKKCCGGLFADDVVLIAPSAKNLEKLLKKVHRWTNLNEMTFGIEKCATMVIKPMNFQSPPNYSVPNDVDCFSRSMEG